MIDFSNKQVFTFDCYGTLIDWETGLLEALRPILRHYQIELSDNQMLEIYAGFEAEAELGPYQTYRNILASGLRSMGNQYGFKPSPEQLTAFSGSVEHWPAFPDSAKALAELKRRYKLAPITNCDDDLFAFSNRKLGVEFDWIITAQQVRSYKPSLFNFYYAFGKIGLPRQNILHVAQSLFHDHVPAKQLGLDSVWINRRMGKAGMGATPAAEAKPDLEVPDMNTLAELALK